MITSAFHCDDYYRSIILLSIGRYSLASHSIRTFNNISVWSVYSFILVVYSSSSVDNVIIALTDQDFANADRLSYGKQINEQKTI
jgi:hypothetical protein